MREKQLDHDVMDRYRNYLLQEERSPSTIAKYLRELRSFAARLDGRAITKEAAAGWKEHLLAQGQAPATVNSKLSALNCWASWGWKCVR